MKTDENLRLVLITGLSGAGKSYALDSFEDLGYYCVDNMPPALISKFVDIFLQSANKNVALVCDMRGAAFFEDLFAALSELATRKIDYEILFLVADDDVLIRRYKETRRRHPLGSLSLPEAIQKEREALSELRGRANREIDTSFMKPWELKTKIVELFEPGKRDKNMQIRLISFGFKYGLPRHADLVFDVRFLPNPYYVEHLRALTGEEDKVQEYLLRWPETTRFINLAQELLQFTIPLYVKEGKTSLVITIGCTGGKHRSVFLAEKLGRSLGTNFNLVVEHRDIHKE